MVTARAFWTIAPGRGEIREEALPPRGPNDVLVETAWSAISRGTESLVLHGRVPPSEYERMRAPHQAGDFPFPVKYGYANVGRVLEGPATLVGRYVFSLYPHQSHFVVPASEVLPIFDEVPPERAVLAANLETAINATWDAELRIGDQVAVVGGGVVGCLVAYLAGKVPGTDVQLVDVVADRARAAAALGVYFALPGGAWPDADVVFHTSGAPSGLATALALAGHEATVAELSWYGDQDVAVALGGAFHARRLTVKSSQVGGIPAPQRARWTHQRRLALALTLLADPALDALFAPDVEFEDLPKILPSLTTGLCHRVRYSPADVLGRHS